MDTTTGSDWQSKKQYKLERGPMPNVMAALPNIGGALYESSVIPFLIVPRRKVWLTPAAGVPCSIKRCQYKTQDLDVK